MSTMLPVLRGAARAISPSEFIEALYAVTPPRFPSARGTRHRNVGLAVSGGVDSMALAYLCSQMMKRRSSWLKVADHQVKSFHAFIVDHGLREGSAQEAQAVAKVLRVQLGLGADIHPVRWDREIGPGVDPNSLPNVESLARRMRYRLLGLHTFRWNITSLLLAHHEDDQYETVLMRLMSGHGMRGLRGIKSAADIPECSDMHGVCQSGFIDDLERDNPLYTLGITRRQRRFLKRSLRSDIDPEVWAREMDEGLYEDGMEAHPYLHGYMDNRSKRSKRAPSLPPIDIEDGGISIYRPLLEFSKERIIATCVENGIPWFEDHTNADPTLTMRNAVRHLVRNHELPVALQKPAILQLAERCRESVAAQDAEAERLLGRVLIHDFEPNVGSVVVQLPDLTLPSVPRKSSALRRERKRARYTRVASLLMQKLLALVTPEQQLTPVANLASAVARLFPVLAGQDAGKEPKAFTICGVQLTPLPGPPLRWYLSRAPYPSQQPRPVVQVQKQFYTRRWRTTPFKWAFSRWSNWALFDNRYWVSVRSRVPFELTVAPFELEHAKAFREALGDQRSKDMLEAVLKRYAPGKVRYTLPAVYVRGDIGALIAGEEDWRVHEDIINGGDAEATPGEAEVELGDGIVVVAGEVKKKRKPPVLKRQAWIRKEAKRILDDKVRLVALPTMGIAIQGTESWVEWRFRYRKVDISTLAAGMQRTIWRRDATGRRPVASGRAGRRGRRVKRNRGS